MEYFKLNEYISNVITENNIDKSIDHLIETIEWETKDCKSIKEDIQLYIDWMQQYTVTHLPYVTEKCEKDKTDLAKLEENIIFCKNKIRVYEKSLWNISSDDKDNVSWLMQLEEKNQYIDLLKSKLFRYKKADEDCKLIGEVDDFYFAFYLDSITRQIFELEEEIAYLKDIEKSMKDYMENSGEVEPSKEIKESVNDHVGNSEMLKNEGNKNCKNEEAINKEKHDLQEWHNFLDCLMDSVSHIRVPVEYWSNRLSTLKKKEIKMTEVEEILTSINNTTDEQKLQNLLQTLSTITKNYNDTLHIGLFNACYKNSPEENRQIFMILYEQLKTLEKTLSELRKECPSATMLDERNCRVAELEDQYVKLTKRSDKCIQDQVAAFNENLIKYKTEIEAVRNKCEELMEKHENECKIVMTNKHTSTLGAEERKCSIKIEKQQKEELTFEQEMSDKKKMSETEVQYFKDDQTNATSSKEIKNTEKEIKKKIFGVKYENFRNKDKNQWLKIHIKVYKDVLNNLMHLGDIDKMIATYQTKKNTNIAPENKDDSRLLNTLLFNKLLLYHNIEQANYIQTAIRRGNKHYDRLFQTKITKHACVRSQDNTSRLKCDPCKISNDKLRFATKIICDISHDITTTSAMFHMLPFKKFFKTILEYIMTKGKTKPERKKRKKRVKPTVTLESELMEKQELSDLSDDYKHTDSLSDIEEHFNDENPFNNINLLKTLDEEEVGELNEN